MENHARSTVLSQGPFEAYLAQHFAQASHYYGVCHPSAPNYLSATAGTPLQCGTDKYTTYTTSNVVSLLTTAGQTNWSAYMQSMPSACDTSNAGTYVVHHDPFTYLSNVVGNRSYCDQHVVNLSQLNASISAGTVPAFAWVTPNNIDNSANSSVATGDAWLRSFLSPLINDSFFRSSVFFLTYDESISSDTSGYNGTSGGNVYFAAISPFARAGYTDTTDSSHYNLLSTVEWLLGLGSTGHHDGTSQFPAMRSLFNFSSSPPPPPHRYPVSGSVVASNGTALPGATLTWSNQTNSSAVPLNSSGAFSTSLPNGTYHFTASASGFASSETNVTVAGAPLSGVELTLTSLTPPPPPPRLEAVSGQIFNATSGAGLPGAELIVANLTASLTTVAGTNGSFSLLVYNGSYDVRVNDTGYAPLYTSWTVRQANLTERYSLNATGAIVPPSNTSTNASSTAYPVVVKVIAVDTNTSLVDRTFTVTNLGNGSSTVVTTDASGLLHLSLPNGTFALVIRSAGFAPAAIDLFVQGSQLVPLPVPLETAASPPSVAPSASTGPASLTVLVVSVIAGLLLSAVAGLGAIWIWEGTRGPTAPGHRSRLRVGRLLRRRRRR